MDINQTLRASYEESKKIIKEAQANNKLVLFVGAGASIDSKMPSWKEAIGKVKKRLGIKENDYLKIPQYYYDARGKKEYTALMRKIFKYGQPLSTSTVHKKIMQFNASTIITTNYDHLIEQASEENAEVRQVISCDSDLPYETASKELIKMHGDFEHDNFVLKEDDYLHYSSNFKLIENYIKSIIGSKVILFLGYSFNDPDIKQIFTWVKDILKKDFQRAYLINVDDEYDPNKEEYYKNLGINVIFAKAWLDDTKNMDQSKLLIGTLDKILLPEELEPVEAIYEKLKDLYDLHYIYKKYIADAFGNYGVAIDQNNYLYARNSQGSKILSDIYDADSNEHTEKLRDIIEHSDIKGYLLNDKTIELNKENVIAQWAKSVFNFDFEKLRKIRSENDNFLNENNPEMYLVQASISYYLEDYIASYNYLKQASKYFYHNQLYVYYFISEVNKKYLSKLIPKPIKDSDTEKNKLLEKIKSETDGINLDRILRSLPNINNDEFLNDILQFTISYSVFQSLYNKSIQSKKEANTNYIIYSGPAAYEQLQSDTIDFFKYELENHLLLDHFQLNVDVYKMYIRGKLLSTSSPDKKDELLFGRTIIEHNVHSKALNKFDLYIILKYMGNAASIRELFNSYSIININVNDDGLNYLNIIVDNILKTKNKKLLNINYWNLIALCGRINLTQDVVDKILESMIHDINYDNFSQNQNIIIDFVNNARHQKLLIGRITYLKKILDEALREMISRERTDYEHLVKVLGFSIKELGKLYTNNLNIKKMMNMQFDIVLIDLYPVCSKDIKDQIQKFYQGKIFDPINENLDIYCKLVVNKIIFPREDIEEKIINIFKKDNSSMGDTKPIPGDLLRPLVTLYLNDEILDKQQIKELIGKYAFDIDKWLVDPTNFDYTNFHIDWLKECNLPLLEKLSKEAGEKIKREFINTYQHEYLDKNLLDIYFKYFA